MNRVWGLVLPAETSAPIGVPTGGLRGDELMDALVPTVARLVGAVHDLDRGAVAAAFAEAGRLAGDPLAAAWHLAVLAAGMVSEDPSPSAALGWTRNPELYHQLKSGTTDALTASLRAG